MTPQKANRERTRWRLSLNFHDQPDVFHECFIVYYDNDLQMGALDNLFT